MSARRGLIRVFYERGLAEACLELGAEARRLEPESIESLLAQAESFTFGGLSDLAVPLFQRVQALDPANEGAYWFEIPVRVWSSDDEAAIERGEEYFRKFGEDPEIHLWVGMAYHKRGELDRALVHMKRSVELFGDDTNHYAQEYLALLYRDLGREEDARRVLRRGVDVLAPRVEAFPDNVRMRAFLAIFYLLLGERERGDGEFEAAIAARPDDGNICRLVGMIYAVIGDGARAAEVLTRALELGCVDSSEFDRPGVARRMEDPAFDEFWARFHEASDALRKRFAPPRPS